MSAGIGLPIYKSSPMRTLQDWAARLSEIIRFVVYHKQNIESETLTGETWIRGQQIFRKVISVGPLPNNTSKSIPHGILYRNILKINGFGYSPTAGITIPLNIPSPSALANALETYVNGANIVIFTGADYSSYTESYVTLEYTKE